jgi:hypothetical protein
LAIALPAKKFCTVARDSSNSAAKSILVANINTALLALVIPSGVALSDRFALTTIMVPEEIRLSIF